MGNLRVALLALYLQSKLYLSWKGLEGKLIALKLTAD